MAVNTTHAVFEATAATYDRDRMKLIPGHERFYAAALSLIPEDADHILDLGAGTGLFTAMIRAQHPDACLHLIDNSEKMLDQARTRFTNDGKVVFQLDDYTTATWCTQYDAIVSALSIHHLEDPAKRALYIRIFQSLKPGGIFINAEQIAQSTPEAEAQAKTDYLAEVRALGATEQQIAESLVRQQADRCTPVGTQLHWLREAGFTDVSCTYAQGRFAVLNGRRP